MKQKSLFKGCKFHIRRCFFYRRFIQNPKFFFGSSPQGNGICFRLNTFHMHINATFLPFAGIFRLRRKGERLYQRLFTHFSGLQYFRIIKITVFQQNPGTRIIIINLNPIRVQLILRQKRTIPVENSQGFLYPHTNDCVHIPCIFNMNNFFHTGTGHQMRGNTIILYDPGFQLSHG